MGWRITCMVLAGWLLAADLGAAEAPAKGKLLVASRQLQGPTFAETVILLVHYDATGAMGLIVNQPTAVLPSRALPRIPALADYREPLYRGGPVEQRRVLALVRSPEPPAMTATIVEGVHFAPLNDALLADSVADASRLRLYMGYAGWGPGQLDAELEIGSWHVATASEALVFSDEPDTVWQRLVPAPLIRAATDSPGSSIARRPTAANPWQLSQLSRQELRCQPVQVSLAQRCRLDVLVAYLEQAAFFSSL